MKPLEFISRFADVFPQEDGTASNTENLLRQSIWLAIDDVMRGNVSGDDLIADRGIQLLATVDPIFLELANLVPQISALRSRCIEAMLRILTEDQMAGATATLTYKLISSYHIATPTAPLHVDIFRQQAVSSLAEAI